MWDEDKKGYITAEDAIKMLKRLSIPINIDEARVLIASTD